MATRVLALAGLFILMIGLGACVPGEEEREDLSEEASESLAARFADELRDASVPGGVLAVRQNGKTISYPTGSADTEGTPVTAETLFGYRSVSKSLVVTALLHYVDEGAVDIERQVEDYTTSILTEATIGDLAAMTSGVPNYSAQEQLADDLTTEPTRSWTDADLYAMVEDLPQEFDPGAQYQYSNTNTLLIADVLEDLNGVPWSETVLEDVTGPLGLESISYPGDATALPVDSANAFQIDDGEAEELPVVRASAFSAAGGLFGTAEDLAGWAEALGTGELLTEETQQSRLDALESTTSDPESPLYDAYGLGMGRIGDWIGHTGDGLGFQSLAMYHPDSGLSVAIVLNGTGEDPDLPAHILQRIEDEVIQPNGVQHRG